MAARKSNRRPIRIEDLHGLKFMPPGALSPTGERYVFPVKSVREDRKGYDTHLYMAEVHEGGVRQLTFGERSDASPHFSPDGSHLAFLGTRGRHPGIQLLPMDGGEARTLVERDGQFADLTFSPHGRQIACTFRPNDPPQTLSSEEGRKETAPERGGSDGEASRAERQAKERASKVPIYRHIDRLFYRLDGQGFLPKAEPQIWLYDVETGEGRQLTRGKRGCHAPSFSPDGRRIVYFSNVRPDPDLEMARTDLFVIPTRGGRARRIPTPPGPAYLPTFSPDGKSIAYLGHDDIDALWYGNNRVWIVPASGRGAARCTCPGFDQSAEDRTLGDVGGGWFQLRPTWSPDGRWIYFVSSHHGATRLYRVTARGGTPQPLTPDRQHLMNVTLSADGRSAAGTVSSATRPPEVFRYDLRRRSGTPLSHLNRDWAAGLQIQRPRHVRVRSTEKTVVDAWILKPPRFSMRRKYPAVVEVHGGPQGQYGYTFFHEMQLLAAQGYVVIYSNPRGSGGYGRAFCEAIRGAWGTRDFDDVTAVTDYLEKLPYVDRNRIGITGGSYGGYMTNWAVGHTRRYKAAVTQRSVVDLVPFFGSSDMGFSFHHTFDHYPWQDLEGYRRQSPLTYAKQIRTPLLIIHSENDLRCNIEQAENLFATLKVLKRRVEFIRFPEEPHGLSRGGRPDRRQVRLERILDWFERYL
ncbi:MAG: prolyl oligopeptidase family serine peptidase [Candidatus Eisenbacteria bacterium]|nr:prolyl oligopeptidase family serine peptidase [Candidatus Eisenbacteria bacterium]